MRRREKKQENIPKEEFFFSDLKDIQLVSGTTAFAAVLITIISLIFLPADVDKNLIIFDAIFASSFILAYYTIPALYLNSRFMLLPDAVFTIAISIAMFALRDYGEFYIVFYFLIVAVDAFAYKTREFFFALAMIMTAILASNVFLSVHFLSFTEIAFRSIIQLFSVISVAIIMRFFAKQALTERKEKEQIKKLAENTLSAIRQLRSLLDSIGNGIFAVDENEKIILANTASVKILGWDKPISGKSISDVLKLYNDDNQKVDFIKKVLETKKSVSSSDLKIMKEDESIKVYVNVAPMLDSDNKLQGAIILFRDITKEKELEEQKAEFVAVSSHELRTPLTIIEGYLFYMLNGKELKYDTSTRTYIEKAHKSCLDLQRLITDLLEVSRVEQNRFKLSIEEIDIVEVAKEIIADFSDKAKDNNLKLILEIKQRGKINCLVDRGRLKEVLVNLIGNALKFTEQGHVKLIVEKDKNNVKFTVEDTGLGIPTEDQKLIFNKFYRIEGWRTRKTGGTGLGLYISRSIIEKLKGKIWVESKLGKGSRFIFTFPLAIKKSTKKHKNKLVNKKKNETRELKEFVSKL